jgi:DUF4097 and DUF4098 domain-containing protein YvlB
VRPRSITGPFILILIGVYFLLVNIRPDLLQFSRIVDYWPFLLIAAGVVGLIEVLFYVSRGTAPAPRPLGGGIIFWVVVLCFFFAIFGHNRDFRFANFNSDGVNFLGTDYDYDVNAAEPAQGVTRIVLDNLRGNISLKGEDSDAVKVTGRQSIRAFNQRAADRAKSNHTVHLERNGDEMVVRADDYSGGQRLFGFSNDLEIAVPRGITVESRGRSGDLTVDDLDGAVDVTGGRGDVRLTHIGKDVRIDSARSGDIHVVDLKGSLELGGRGSDVQLESIAGPVTIKGEFSGTLEFRALAKPLDFTSSRTEFRVEAIPGDITMDLGDLKMNNVSGPVRFQSQTRDIQITDVTELLDIKIDRGDVGVTATHMPLPKMDIHTRNGDINLSLPERAGFQIDGSTSQGDINSGFGSSLRIDSSGRSATIKGQNGSGPQITVNTDRGTVSVKKS